VFSTGLNDFGQLGIGSSVTHTLEPVEVSGFHERVVEISAGNHHSCAITGKRKIIRFCYLHSLICQNLANLSHNRRQKRRALSSMIINC